MIGYFKKQRWLFYTILAALSWGFWGILTKSISSEISPFTTHFMFTIGMLFSLPVVVRKCKVRKSDIIGEVSPQFYFLFLFSDTMSA